MHKSVKSLTMQAIDICCIHSIDREFHIKKPLIERKKILKEAVKEGKNVLISDFIEEKGEQYYQATTEKGLEGIIAKKKNSSYTQGRSINWLKIKKIKE